MKNYGTQQFGNMIAFRFFCNILEQDRLEMKEAYPGVDIDRTSHRIFIEGAMTHEAYHQFKLHLDVAMANFKADKHLKEAERLQKILAWSLEGAEAVALAEV